MKFFVLFYSSIKISFMDKNQHQSSGRQNESQQTAGQQTGDQGENVQISQPKIDRPEGPFEHSGETFNWTKEEREEKEQQDDQP